MKEPRNVDKLGISAPVDDVLEWFRSAGFTEEIVGKSIQQRDLILFHRTIQPNRRSTRPKKNNDDPQSNSNKEIIKRKTILFMSLVHGNEPLGLINLLHTAEALFVPQYKNLFSLALKEDEELLLLFFPIVNVDAYVLNLNFSQSNEKIGDGCRRTNLNHTCSRLMDTINATTACPNLTNDGVDLNRNFPFDWVDDVSVRGNKICSYSFAGYQPFSEPETRAIRDVVQKYNPIDASISYHSRGLSHQGLLIHPYASNLNHEYKSTESKMRIQNFGESMNRKKTYIVGDAENAIQYSARGTALDWLYTAGNVSTPFVHESGTPCLQRWCSSEFEQNIKNNARVYAEAGVTLVELVLNARQPRNHSVSIFLIFLVFVVSLRVAFDRRLSDPVMLFLRRYFYVPWSTNRRQLFEGQKRDIELQPMILSV